MGDALQQALAAARPVHSQGGAAEGSESVRGGECGCGVQVWDTEIIKHGVWKYHGNKPTDFVLSMAKRLSGEWAPQIATWASCANGPVCPNT